jgi:hypothetical protein
LRVAPNTLSNSADRCPAASVRTARWVSGCPAMLDDRWRAEANETATETVGTRRPRLELRHPRAKPVGEKAAGWEERQRADGAQRAGAVLYLASVSDVRKPQDKVVRAYHPIPKTERRFAAAGGILLFTAGGVAVFIADNDFGTVALLAAGLVLTVLAITGRLPSRISYGDKSVEWVQDLVDSSLNLASGADERDEVVLSLRSDQVPTVVQREVNSAVGSYLSYERAVAAALDRVKPPSSSASLESRRGKDDVADALVSHEGRHLLVEIKYRSSGGLLSSHEIFLVANRMGLVNKKMGAANLLVVANVQLSNGAQEILARTSAVWVLWRDENDDAALRAAIDKGLSQTPRF